MNVWKLVEKIRTTQGRCERGGQQVKLPEYQCMWQFGSNCHMYHVLTEEISATHHNVSEQNAIISFTQQQVESWPAIQLGESFTSDTYIAVTGPAKPNPNPTMNRPRIIAPTCVDIALQPPMSKKSPHYLFQFNRRKNLRDVTNCCKNTKHLI